MPTGYTNRITDTTTLQEFAIACARAFGATVTMRDEPVDAPIPEQFDASTYHVDALKGARARLVELEATSLEQAAVLSKAEYEAAMKRNEKRIEEAKATERRYRRVLDAVKAWTPPTSEHVGLKDFMAQQLESSIDFDCSLKYMDPPEQLSPTAWLEKAIASARWDIDYHLKGHAEELARVDSRNRWIKQLRESLR